MSVDYKLLYQEAQAQSDRNYQRYLHRKEQSDRNYQRYQRELNKAEHYRQECDRLQGENDELR